MTQWVQSLRAGRINQKGRVLRRLLWAVGGMFSLVLFLWVMYIVMGWIIHSEKEVEVPELRGENLEGALDLLKPLRSSSCWVSRSGCLFSRLKFTTWSYTSRRNSRLPLPSVRCFWLFCSCSWHCSAGSLGGECTGP